MTRTHDNIKVLLYLYEFPKLFYVKYALACAKLADSKKPSTIKCIALVERYIADSNSVTAEELRAAASAAYAAALLLLAASASAYAADAAAYAAASAAYAADAAASAASAAAAYAADAAAYAAASAAYAAAYAADVTYDKLYIMLEDMIKSEYNEVELILMKVG